MWHFLALVLSMLPAVTTNAPKGDMVIVPPITYRLADPESGVDGFDYGIPIRVRLKDTSVLAGINHPKVRLFPALYVDETGGDPMKLCILKNNNCGYFQWRPIEYDPKSISQPTILVGVLPDSAFRCKGKLLSTEFYLVIEDGGTVEPVIRIDFDAVPTYFKHAYRFRVSVADGHKCRTGTDAMDREQKQLRAQHPKAYAARKQRSGAEDRKIAKVDVKAESCVEIIKDAADGKIAGIGAPGDSVECGPNDLEALAVPAPGVTNGGSKATANVMRVPW